MPKQMIYVDDANPAACGNVGMVYNGSDTLTSSKLYSGTSIELSETLNVTGATSLSTLNATGDVVVYDFESLNDIDVAGAANIRGDVIIEGICTHDDAVALGGNRVIAGAHGAYVIPLTGLFTILTTDATADLDASLHDGHPGQLKIVILGADGGNNLVITPVNFMNGTTLTLDTAKQYAVFLCDGAEWWALSHNGTIA